MRTLLMICLIVLANSCTNFQKTSDEVMSTLVETRSTHIYTIVVFDVDHTPIEGASIRYKFVSEKYPFDNIDGISLTDSNGFLRLHFSVHPDPYIKDELVFSSSFAYSISKMGYIPTTGSLRKTVKDGRTSGFLNEDREEVILLKQ